MEADRLKIELEVEGMTCANCALGVTKFLEKKGLEDVYVNFATNEVRFTLPEKEENLNGIVNGIQQLGYSVTQSGMAKQKGKTSLEQKLIFCAVLTLPLLLAMFLPFKFLHNPWVQFGIALPVYLVGFFHFGRSAISSLKTGVPNMDVLIFIGSTAAFVYSLTGAIMGLGEDFLFFETAATIVTLVLLGNVIEKRSVKRTTTAIAELQQLQPEKAQRIFFDMLSGDSLQEVNVDELQINDRVQVNTGDRIPLDGIVDSGNGEADESMLTGESLPVSKQKGDIVSGGTLLVSGSLQITITGTTQNSLLQRIIALVKDAQLKKPEVQRLADRIAAWFVPIVLAIALVTFLFNFYGLNLDATESLLRSIAVLVIACPCAMGLATPTAVMVGLGRSVKKGILIKGASTMEQLAKTEVLVMDKTGTLTDGKFNIKNVTASDKWSEKIPAIVSSLEKHSNHPLSASLLKYFENLSDTKIDITYIEEIKGIGIKGTMDGKTVAIGNKHILSEAPEKSFDVYIAYDGVQIAGIELNDAVKPEAKSAISYFKSKGIQTILLSGDGEKKCKDVSESLGLDAYYFQQSPADKLDFIRSLSVNKKVTMVGDGINDSPALAAATTAVSLSEASSVAIQSAQVVLLHGDLNKLKESHQLSNMTLTTIKQNLFWAFFYNTLAIPIAAAGFLNPMIAALSMAFSDVIVIGNSIRLRTKKIR